jgi:hypothetical protein
MNDFMKTQIDVAERMFKMMVEDHKERVESINTWAEMNIGLMRKLDERDKRIADLEAELKTYRAAEKI